MRDTGILEIFFGFVNGKLVIEGHQTGALFHGGRARDKVGRYQSGVSKYA